MNVLNEKVLKTLKCPCCFRYMKASIYVCLGGHSICDSCWDADFCKICKLPLTDTRNFALEDISMAVYYPCANEERGCREFFKLNELGEHHQLCNYRSYSCRLSKRCFWQGPRDTIKKHFLDKHDNNVLIGPECVCMWNHEKSDTVYLMLAFDEMFYIHMVRKKDIVYWVVQYLGRSEDVILFCFEFQIFTDQYNDRGVKFSEICHDDVKDDTEEIINSGFCVAIPVPILETYLNIEGVAFYKIEIKRA